jgi:hypothetical protein
MTAELMYLPPSPAAEIFLKSLPPETVQLQRMNDRAERVGQFGFRVRDLLRELR